jgi:glycerol uptake facilitator-like aquaporin
MNSSNKSILPWILFIPAALFAYIASGYLWEYVSDLIVYILWPNSSKTIGPEDTQLYHEVLNSNIYTFIRSMIYPIISTGAFYFVGIRFFNDDSLKARKALTALLVTIFVHAAVLLTLYILNLESQLNIGLKEVILFLLLIGYFVANFILWYKYFLNKFKDDKVISNEVITRNGNNSKTKFKLPENVKNILTNTLSMIMVIYIIIGHIYFFYALYQYSQENSFL